jgi:hypothetical protein
METTDSNQSEFELRSARANKALVSFRNRIQELLNSGPEYLAEYAGASWEIIKDHHEVTKDNGPDIRNSLMVVNRLHQDQIHTGLIERGEKDAGFALLHDIIHDAANLTNGIHVLSRKW